MNLIIIEDEREITNFLKTNLEKIGFKIDIAKNGITGLKLINKNNYDLIILDLNLPDLSGDFLCKKIRSDKKMLPILVISADNQLERKVNLLNTGADDYLAKPFELEELIARIQSLLRRPSIIQNEIIKIADIEINREKQLIKINGKEVYLTKKEFLILEYLANHQTEVVSKNELIEHVWDSKVNTLSKTIEMHMVNLRKKITTKKEKPIIKTVSGRGYKIN